MDPFILSKGGGTGGLGGLQPPPPIFLTRGLRPPNISEDGARNGLEFARGVEVHPLSFYLTNQPLQYKTSSAATDLKSVKSLRLPGKIGIELLAHIKTTTARNCATEMFVGQYKLCSLGLAIYIGWKVCKMCNRGRFLAPMKDTNLRYQLSSLSSGRSSSGHQAKLFRPQLHVIRKCIM